MKTELSISGSDAVLLVRALHALVGNVDAARHSYAISIDEAQDQRTAIFELERRIKDVQLLDWTTTGYALGR